MKRNATIFACLVIQMCVGILYLWSAFKGNIIRAYGAELGWTASAANLVSSFMLFFYVFGCLFGGILNDRKGPHLTCVCGMTLFTLGIALSAFARHIAFFMLAYAVLAGLGSGFGNAACISCIQKWLPHRRGLASGMACAAFGLSTVVFTPLSAFLMRRFADGTGVVNFVPVFLILAAIFAVLGFGASPFVRLPDSDYLSALPVPKKSAATGKDVSLSELLGSSAFWALFLCIFFINGTWNLCVPVIKDLGVQRGLTERLAIACVSFTGITNAAGRLCMASLSDRIGRSAAFYIVCAMTFAGAVLLLFIGGMGYFAVIAFVAFAYGAPASLFAALCTDLFGAKHSGRNLGIALLALGFSSVFFNFVSARLLHATVDHMAAAFVMGAVTAVIPAGLMWYLQYKTKRSAK